MMEFALAVGVAISAGFLAVVAFAVRSVIVRIIGIRDREKTQVCIRVEAESLSGILIKEAARPVINLPARRPDGPS